MEPPKKDADSRCNPPGYSNLQLLAAPILMRMSTEDLRSACAGLWYIAATCSGEQAERLEQRAAQLQIVLFFSWGKR